MPVILGIQYPDIPTEVSTNGADPCRGMNEFSDTTSQWYLDCFYAANTAPLANVILQQFDLLGVEVQGRDIDEGLGLSDMQNAAADYAFYIQSWIDWLQPLGEHVEGLMDSALPGSQFMFWYADTFGFTLEIGDSPDGFGSDIDLEAYPACGFWKNKIARDLLPNLELLADRLRTALGYFDFVTISIQARLQDLIDTTDLANQAAEGYGIHLDQQAENEQKEREILQARFLSNVSQFSLLGGLALVGISQTDLTK